MEHFKVIYYLIIFILSSIPSTAISDDSWSKQKEYAVSHPYKNWFKHQGVYILLSYGARELDKGFGLYLATVGMISNPALFSSTNSVEYGYGQLTISAYNVAIDHKDNKKDKNQVFLTNYIAWNLLHVFTERKYLFGLSDKNKNYSINLRPISDGVFLGYRHQF